MTSQNPEISGTSIVLVGDFNPKIFHPIWFSSEGLIKKNEAAEANITTVHPEICVFQLDWLHLEVTRNRFVVQTSQEPYFEILRDLAYGTFELLHHTPLKQLGINYNAHYRIKSEKEWHEFGDKITPKEIWYHVLEKPGMSAVTIEGDLDRDGFKGHTKVKVEPSKKFHPGVFFDINDHYEVEDQAKSLGGKEIINILKQIWKKSIDRSVYKVNTLMENR
jgi:hypothetical protein